MKTRNTMGSQVGSQVRCWIRRTYAAALAVAVTASLPLPALAGNVTPPDAPGVEVEAGNRAFLIGHATGTQNYVCSPSGAGVAWALFTPQATLFDDNDKQLITHFFSPNPHEGGTVRATWQHSRDTSAVWAKAVKSVTPDTSAVAWLLLQVEQVGAQDGPTGGDTLTDTSFIQRVNTVGGVAPATGCAQTSDLGAKAFVPYTADYVFYVRDAG